jgi:hypothetical protein
MNMKRGLVLSLGAALVAAMAGPAFAVVDVQLNLRYTNPANPTGGGTWDLLVKSSGAQGLAGIQAKIGGALGVTGIDTPLSAITANASVFTPATSVFKFQTVGGKTEIVAGDDLAGPLVLNVGKGAGTPGNVPNDDLFTSNSVFWDNSALIASGSWTGARPTLVAADILVNEFNGSGAAVAATLGTVSVRGDSVGVDGLKPGDANRDGVVNQFDVSTLAGNFGGSGKTWDTADFNSDGIVNQFDVSALAGNFNQVSPPPAISAVPEPTSAILAGVALLGLRFRGRRN